MKWRRSSSLSSLATTSYLISIILGHACTHGCQPTQFATHVWSHLVGVPPTALDCSSISALLSDSNTANGFEMPSYNLENTCMHFQIIKATMYDMQGHYQSSVLRSTFDLFCMWLEPFLCKTVLYLTCMPFTVRKLLNFPWP